jgi:multisubunit Na+/H+ antiporter MnhE subunit
MLHPAAMLTGLWVLWLLLTQRWNSVQDLAIGGGAALFCVLFAARFGGFGREGGAFTHAPQLIALVLSRASAVVRGALGTIRAAIAADVTLKPALVRVKTRPSSDFARAALADMIGAAPGAVVVDTDAEGLLVHVLDEDAIDAAALGRFETRVLSALDGKASA